MAASKCTHLDDLPAELVVFILQQLDTFYDVANFGATSRHYREIIVTSIEKLPRLVWSEMRLYDEEIELWADFHGHSVTFKRPLIDWCEIDDLFKRRLVRGRVKRLTIANEHASAGLLLLMSPRTRYDVQIDHVHLVYTTSDTAWVSEFLSGIEPKSVEIDSYLAPGVLKLPKSVVKLTGNVGIGIDVSEATHLREIDGLYFDGSGASRFFEKVFMDPTLGVLDINNLNYKFTWRNPELRPRHLPDNRNWRLIHQGTQTTVNCDVWKHTQLWQWTHPGKPVSITVAFEADWNTPRRLFARSAYVSNDPSFVSRRSNTIAVVNMSCSRINNVLHYRFEANGREAIYRQVLPYRRVNNNCRARIIY